MTRVKGAHNARAAENRHDVLPLLRHQTCHRFKGRRLGDRLHCLRGHLAGRGSPEHGPDITKRFGSECLPTDQTEPEFALREEPARPAAKCAKHFAPSECSHQAVLWADHQATWPFRCKELPDPRAYRVVGSDPREVVRHRIRHDPGHEPRQAWRGEEPIPERVRVTDRPRSRCRAPFSQRGAAFPRPCSWRRRASSRARRSRSAWGTRSTRARKRA